VHRDLGKETKWFLEEAAIDASIPLNANEDE
jgi:hypothetical protein